MQEAARDGAATETPVRGDRGPEGSNAEVAGVSALLEKSV